MQLVIISGRSGSGISSALRVLEDSGMTCIDNLPVGLLEHLVNTEFKQTQRYAVSIDARSNLSALKDFDQLFKHIESRQVKTQIVFLDARDEILIKRFSETRRKHPLTSDKIDLKEAINAETELLTPIHSRADQIIDTSSLSVHQLRNLVHKWVTGSDSLGTSVQFQSFGFKHGLPADADIVFDVRCLPNPFWVPDLRGCTGNDAEVQNYLAKQPLVNSMIGSISDFLNKWVPEYEKSNRSYITVAIGCTGGQHRSVYVCNQLAENFKTYQEAPLVRHRDLKTPS